MRYGYFDDEAREYVITRPDTPQSWSNYLGSTEYGAIITNNCGGYGFYRSGARGRFLRLRFNTVPLDQPGRYFYLRDQQTGDFWSASWQPVGKPLHQYESICRHGTGYSIFQSKYAGIETEATYFVPVDQRFEYWRLKMTNAGEGKRSISAFSFCEFTNQWDTIQDQINQQYSNFIIKGSRDGNMLRIVSHDNISSPEDPDTEDGAMHSWLALIGSDVAGYDTSREAFLGIYNGYHNPQVLLEGRCRNSDAYGDNGCGVIQTEIALEPGESKEILVMLGVGAQETVGRKAVAEYGSLERASWELDKLKRWHHQKLNSLSVQTPDPEFNSTINMWGLYNCLINFNWSRSASLVYNGERDGLGYRDSVQDLLGVMAAIPDQARERLELMITGQLSTGGALPVIKPFEHRPGHEAEPKPEEYRSDDCLWLFNAVPAYVAETGDFDFYRKVLPYADKGEDTVFGHLRRALEFNLKRSGRNGLPCGLAADWNDCLKLGYYGESLFVAFQVRFGLTVYAEIAYRLGEEDEAIWARQQRDRLDANIQAVAWDGDWFIWAIGDDGTVYGTKDYSEGQVYLNTQVWSVISGAATSEQAQKSMQTVQDKLATEYGLMLCAPPFKDTPRDVMGSVVYNAGIKENAGIFNHTQGWGVMAECILGRGDRAYQYYRAAMPAAYNDRAEIRQLEPYVQGQTTYSKYSPRAGNCRTSWLTGAAAWSYFSAAQYILGIRPVADGLMLDPCIPSSWDGFTATRQFRGKTLHITVTNPDGICRGIRTIILNGTILDGAIIPAQLLQEENQVHVVMGQGNDGNSR
jgi:cellobiose phosphorylase